MKTEKLITGLFIYFPSPYISYHHSTKGSQMEPSDIGQRTKEYNVTNTVFKMVLKQLDIHRQNNESKHSIYKT